MLALGSFSNSYGINSAHRSLPATHLLPLCLLCLLEFSRDYGWSCFVRFVIELILVKLNYCLDSTNLSTHSTEDNYRSLSPPGSLLTSQRLLSGEELSGLIQTFRITRSHPFWCWKEIIRPDTLMSSQQRHSICHVITELVVQTVKQVVSALFSRSAPQYQKSFTWTHCYKKDCNQARGFSSVDTIHSKRFHISSLLKFDL